MRRLTWLLAAAILCTLPGGALADSGGLATYGQACSFCAGTFLFSSRRSAG
jgi:hypothetical protein